MPSINIHITISEPEPSQPEYIKIQYYLHREYLNSAYF
jgi:hypothetical protein